ncbi:MAG: ATP-binding cassette domain-containing protein, partial [Fibrobacteres bacterium]|nr:ATP-binding cassette domain-containing protein [Fibrobacterota bacterium]
MSEKTVVAENMNFWYGEKHILHNINMDIMSKKVTAFIGPSGCGKTTFLRCLNRMCDLVKTSR